MKLLFVKTDKTCRARWRIQRQTARIREYQDDVRDRQLEEDERKALEIESEEFLKRQMLEMAELEERQREAGLLTEDAAPIKLAITRPVNHEIKREEKPDIGSKFRPGISFDGEEEEEDPAKKKKRTLVKLEYEGDGLTEAEKIAKRNARLLEIRALVPKEKKRLWTTSIEWAAVNEVCSHQLPYTCRLTFRLDHHPGKAAPFRARKGDQLSWRTRRGSWRIHT